MASIFAIVCTISLAFSIAKAQFYVTPGFTLEPTAATTSLLSPSGLYAFGFYPQSGGYGVGIYMAGLPERTVVWTASRDNLPFSDNATLRFTSDGRLAVEQAQGQQINIFDAGGAYFATMQDSGNFVLYDSTGTRVLWQTFEHPTNTLFGWTKSQTRPNIIFKCLGDRPVNWGVQARYAIRWEPCAIPE
ncbi:putative non-specific serine/threonine protein kinase [Helianthus annuus]|nr:putative non-specific serine/threonine protein kinase [Helianthus annuus]